MAVKLNLLPEDYALSGPVAQIVKFSRPATVIALALFLVMSVGMVGFFIFSSVSLNNLSNQNSSLVSQISAQNSSQQQIVLLKDRLSNIKKVQSLPSVTKNLTNIDAVMGKLTGDSLIAELDVDAQKTNASLIFKSNSDLTNFLSSLSTNTAFSSITLTGFNYSPSSGYEVNLSFIGK